MAFDAAQILQGKKGNLLTVRTLAGVVRTLQLGKC